MKNNYSLIFPGLSVIITQHADRQGGSDRKSCDVPAKLNMCIMEWYRSGYNGPDSKSGVPATVPWVRIPPTPPNSCWKCSIRSVLIEHFHYISQLFRAFSGHCMCEKFLSPANFNTEKSLCCKAFRDFGEKTGEKKLRLFRLRSKPRKHGVCRGKLCAVVQMGIDVCRRGEIAVTKPFLNLFHVNTVCEK